MLKKETLAITALVIFFSLGMLSVAFHSYQGSKMRQDINQDGAVNNSDYLEVFSLVQKDESLKSDFYDVYSQAVYDPTGEGVWDEEDKMMIINGWGAREGEKRYDLRADLYPDGIINEVDMQMARVAEESQGQILSNPLACMNDLIRRAAWTQRMAN